MKKNEATNDKIKIGVLFSQSGPMAVPESAHLRGVLLACEEINAQGGIDNQLIDPIILDPAGDDRRYAEMATELLLKHQVNFIFGGCLSSSRKSVLPIIERFNGILFYPSVYEGFEYSPNVIYGGGIPNQLVLPLLEYIYSHYGKRIALIGMDYVYPKEINRIVSEFLNASDGDVVAEHYLPFNATEQETQTVLRQALAQDPDVILSTVVGKDSVNLLNMYSSINPDKNRPPIASMTTVESELANIEEGARGGHIAVAPYFASIEKNRNKQFVASFKARFGDNVSPCVYSEITYSLVHFFANALHLAGQSDTESVLAALSGAVFKSPGGDLAIDLETNHLTLRPYVAKSTPTGQYEILSKHSSIIRPDPYLVSYDRSITAEVSE